MTAYLTLLLGLLLPWLVGVVWLRASEKILKSGEQSHIASQLGYGFFIGYAILFGCLHLADQLNALSYWPIVCALAILAIAGVAAGKMLGSTSHASGTAPLPKKSTKHHWLFWLLLGLTCLHLLLNAWEVFYRPVYAWDAWTTWIYRAKVWFFSGDIYQLASPKAWLADPEGATHAIPAYRYPTFPSVIPLWAVISFGHWSDSLVNTPVIGCGIALALALYGACRHEGLSSTFAMAAAYALISLPIIGAHLSLAGYADIWMAGFTGLGLVALLRGLIHASTFSTVLGIALLAMSVCLKYEGLAWLMIGVALMTITLIASKPPLRLAMALALAAFLIAIALGVTSVELPALGVMGIKGNFLYVPGLGRYELVTYNVLPIYVESFFARSSWHLLWSLTVLALIGLLFIHNRRAAAILFLFYLLFAASQMLIFGATEKGKFAELNTAVNRLIIHFLPALIFALVLTSHQLVKQWRYKPKAENAEECAEESGEESDTSINLTMALAPLGSIVLVIAGVWIFTTLSTAPASNDTSALPESISFQPQNFAPMMGGGRLEAGSLVINRFDRGMAIASVAPITIDTQHYPALSYDLNIEGSSTAMFFWRNAATPEDIQMTLIDPPGNSTLFLADNAQWGKQIIELGFIAYGVKGDTYRLSELSLKTWGGSEQFELMMDDWLTYEPITQKFINWIDGGRNLQLINLTLALTIALALLVLGLALFTSVRKSGKHNATPINLLVAVLVLWLVADAVWLKNRLIQSYDTKDVYGDGIDPKRNERANEGFPFQGVAAAIEPFTSQSDEILVLPQTERMWFEAARLNLQLAPIETTADAAGIRAIPRGWQGLILIVKDDRQNREGLLEHASKQSQIKFIIRYEDERIMLLQPAS
ncbi:MAG: hypothetical protein ABJ013_09935 [Halioglobus sp.]